MESLVLFLVTLGTVAAAFLTTFAWRQNAPKATLLVFAYVLIGNTHFFVVQYFPHPIFQVTGIVSVYLGGPIIWWLIKSQLSGAQSIFNGWHALPAIAVIPFLIGANDDLKSVILLAGTLNRIGYCSLAAFTLWKGRFILEGRKQTVWLGTFVILGLWLSGWDLVELAGHRLTVWLVDYKVTLIEALVSSAVPVALLWWALMRPDIYLDQRPHTSAHYNNSTDFDLQTYTHLEETLYRDKVYLDDKLNLEKLAHNLAVTPRELSNAINRCAGKSFRAYLREKRIAHAKTLLSEKTRQKQSIFEIAMEAGFGTKSSFNESFKASTGMTPTEFRKRTPR